MRAAFGLALAVALGFAMTSCSGATTRLSKAEYQIRLRSAERTMVSVTNATIWDASTSGWPVGSARAQRAARTVRVGLDGVAATLDRLRPPKNVAQDNRDLASGLRALAREYALELDGGNAKVYAALFVGHGERQFDRAQRDLMKKGYTFEPRGTGVEQVINADGTPRPSKPFPFAVVSQAGRQAAVELQASFCPPQPPGHSCGGIARLVTTSGPRPRSLTVVRPGERIRLSVNHPDEMLISLYTQRLCSMWGDGVHSFFVLRYQGRRPVWRVQLPPGRYVATFSLDRLSIHGSTEDSGIVGLLVSKSEPERILSAPSC